MRLSVNSTERVAEHPGGRTAQLPASSGSNREEPAGTVEVVPVRALLLGERLDTRSLERNEPLAVAPLAVDIPEGGVAVAFRYGAVILFGAATPAMDDFVASLTPLVTGALRFPNGTTCACWSAPTPTSMSISPATSFCVKRPSSDCNRSPTSSRRVWCTLITRRGRRELRPHRAACRDIVREGARQGTEQGAAAPHWGRASDAAEGR